MKRILCMLCMAILILSLFGCKKEDTADYAGKTIVGRVSEVTGTTVTLKLGELEEIKEDKVGGAGEEAGNEGIGAAEAPPEKPEEEAGGMQVPPEKSGEAESENMQAPPEKPEGDEAGEEAGGEKDGQTPPDMPGDRGMAFTESDEETVIDIAGVSVTKVSEKASAEEIAVNDILKITFNNKNEAESVEIITEGMIQNGAGGFGGSNEVVQGSSANTIDEDGAHTDTVYTSDGDDENALRIVGAKVSLDKIKADKGAGATSNTENGDFYGMNAAVLATNGADVTIKNAEVTSSAQNGNGIFSYGTGTTVNVSDTVITTSADNSGGIQTTGGGITNAERLTINTSGNSSAAIRSDRGGGTVHVDAGTYTSNGYNSPAVYSTADITVKNASLTANHSEALVIEGKNSITLENCDVTGNMSDTKGTSSDENVHNVMIYQSMSGDADVGTSTFSMTGGSLTSQNGDMFYVTNTHSVLTLTGVSIENQDDNAYFMNICGNSASRGWGTAGKNGAQVEFTADAQSFSGNIVVDTISTLNMTLKNKSEFTGTVNLVDNAAGGTVESDLAVIEIEEGCTWNLTGDCTVTRLVNKGTINDNGYTITELGTGEN